jgi:hypothetical protein
MSLIFIWGLHKAFTLQKKIPVIPVAFPFNWAMKIGTRVKEMDEEGLSAYIE